MHQRCELRELQSQLQHQSSTNKLLNHAQSKDSQNFKRFVNNNNYIIIVNNINDNNNLLNNKGRETKVNPDN